MKAIESFHMKCQPRILGIRWHDVVRNSEVSLRTGLEPVSDRIIRGCNAIFGHVARLPDNTPAHQAMLRQVELSVGRPPNPTWKRPPGRPRTKGENVTSAGWQVTLCDPMWHVSSRSGMATLRTATHLLLTYLLTYKWTDQLCRDNNNVPIATL